VLAREESLAELRQTAKVLIEELKDSMTRLLSVIEALERASEEDGEAYEELEVELSVLATDMHLDAASVESVLERITDARGSKATLS
jgi:hypothetical protein